MPQPDLVAMVGGRGVEALEEARRTLQICNACRYCEGFCAVFPAMTRRREFPDADVIHLANLCHGCRDCFHACQYAPPHDFGINVPRALAAVRLDSYRASAAAPDMLFSRPLVFAGVLLVTMTAITEVIRRWLGGDPGARGFYAVLGRDAMIAFGLSVAGLAAIGLVATMLRYLRLTRAPGAKRVSVASWGLAVRNAVSLRYLGGNGVGCNDTDESFGQRRRVFHHLMAGGFLSCFAATSAGAFYDHVLGRVAPYPLLSVPGILGSMGGLAIIAGTLGLLRLKTIEAPEPALAAMTALDRAMLMLLLTVALSGLLLRAFDEGPALAGLTVFHLASVAALLLALPFGKFIHAPLRLLALGRDAQEAQS